jgi:anti-sigma factor RsiW
MSTTTHPFAPEEVMAFVDGELSADRAQSISAHVETCSECQEVVASLRSTSHSISNWTAGTVPVHLEKRMLDRSHGTANVLRESFISKLRRFFRPSPAMGFTAAAFVFVLILIGMSAGRYERRVSTAIQTMDHVTRKRRRGCWFRFRGS